MPPAEEPPPNNGSADAEGPAWASLQPAAAPGAAVGGQAFLGRSQREAADVIRRALAEGHVFAALTGAPGLGNTMVLSTVLATQSGPLSHVIRVDRPDQVSAEQTAEIERLVLGQPVPTEGPQAVLAEIERLVLRQATGQAASANGRHTVLVVDNAHMAPPGLLRCLTRIAASGRLAAGSPQVVLVGRPELWDRLKAKEFAPLVERIAVRPVLQPMTDDDLRGLIRHLLDQPRRIFGHVLAEGAEQEVLRLAAGSPERIGAIMRSTITLGDIQTRPPISIKMVRSAAAMLDGTSPERGGRRRARIVKPVLVAILAAAVAAGLALAVFDEPLDRALPAALDFAKGAFTRRAPPAGQAAQTPAEAARRVPADGPHTDGPPAPAADAPRTEGAQTAPPPATRDDVDRLAESHPQPAPPAPALPEPQDQPAPAASPPSALPPPSASPPPSAEQPPGADRAQDPADAPGPPPAAAASAAPNTAANPHPPAGTTAAPPDPAMVAALLRRGDEVFALGDISTARRFYERTIPAGSSLGARGIARTYDPAVLGRGNPAADPAAAAAWYNMAAALSDVETATRRTPPKGER